jgi:hypothetical protein
MILEMKEYEENLSTRMYFPEREIRRHNITGKGINGRIITGATQTTFVIAQWTTRKLI